MSQPQKPKQGFNLSSWALNNQSFVVFLMLLTVLAGTFSFLNLSRGEDPPFTIKTMVVSAAWPGATMQDTASLLTNLIEKKLEETPNLDHVQSYSRPGEAVVFVYLRDDTKPAQVTDAWYQVRKKMDDLVPRLPEGVRGPFLNDEFADTFGIIYGFQYEGFSAGDIRQRVDNVRTRLMAVPDVGKIELIGVQPEQITIAFQTRKLAALNLNIDAVIASLQEQNAVAPAGTIETASEKIAVTVDGAFTSEDSIRKVVLRVDNRFVPLTDIAEVSRGPIDPPSPGYRVNGKPAIGLAISVAEGADVLKFGKEIDAVMAEVTPDLPYGIDVVKVADQTEVVDHAIEHFIKVLLEAIAIVLAVSFLSLGTRAGLVVTVSIPLVLAMTFIGMELAGIGLQRISLGALIIALGLLVDDAMITVEAMVGRLEHGWEKSRAATYAYETTAFPMLTGTLVMIAGFVPVGFAASSAGEYCYSLFMVVLIALSTSWIVAVVFAPLLGVWILPKTVKPHKEGGGRIMRGYARILDLALKHRLATLSLAVLAFGASLVGFTQIEEQFFPTADRPELMVSLTLPQNASYAATDADAQKLEAFLLDDADVDHFSTYIGSGAIRFYLPMDLLLTNDNVTEFVVVAKGLEARDRLQARLANYLESEFPEAISRASPLELGPPVGWPLKFRITGPDHAMVRDLSMQFANLLAENPSTRGINLTAGEPQRSVDIEIDQVRARALGISSKDIASLTATVYTGAPLTQLREGDQQIEVIVRGDTTDRSDLATIDNLQISAPNNRSVPLRSIATVSHGVEDPIIWRRNRQAMIVVQADVAPDMKAATVVEQMRPAIADFQAGLPAGYAVDIGGVVEESAKGSESVFAMLPATLLIMMTLLMIQLRSLARMALAIFMAPFGLIGVVIALLATGVAMGFVAQLGIIALAGMIIRNAVILIEEVDTNIANGMEPDAAIRAASLHRARPIVLTACAAVLGMIPIATSVFFGPMAFAIIGGLAIATFLTLTLLPAAFSMLLQWERRKVMATAASAEIEASAS
ncbi:efflux RND transporter permease subunit [Devosia equisanguinis]|nr:efflux RND transporter permease subunit [Devosia equisanguinis]